MKKAMLLGTACLAVVMAPAFASAQATFFLDERDTIAAIDTPVAPYINEPVTGRGGAQLIRVTPQMPNGANFGNDNGTPGDPLNTDWSLGSLTLYADYTAAAGEVLSSVGLDASIAAAVTSPGLASATVTVFNANADVGSTSSDGNAWDGTSPAALTPTAVAADGTIVPWMKAVRVPVSGAPAMFDSTLGLTTGAGFRLARLNVQAGARCPVPGGAPVVGLEELGVKLSVGSLLITQVSSPGPSADVVLNFGYVGAAPEPTTDVLPPPGPDTGSQAGATSMADDGTIRVMLKGDFNGDTFVNPLDFGMLLATFGPPANHTRSQRWNADWNNDGISNALDFGGLVLMLGSQAVCP